MGLGTILSTKTLELVTVAAADRIVELGEAKLQSAEPIAPNERTRTLVVSAVQEALRNTRVAAEITKFVANMRMTGVPTVDCYEPQFSGGILLWDELLAQDLEDLGPAGSDVAGVLRENAKKRAAEFGTTKNATKLWKQWLTNPVTGSCPYVTLFGVALWMSYVRTSYIDDLIPPPCLILPIMVSAIEAHQRGVQLLPDTAGPPVLASQDNRQIATLQRQHSVLLPPVPAVQANATIALLASSVPLLSSLDAQKLLRWEVFTGHTREQNHVADPRLIDIPDGWPGLARMVGIQSKRGPEHVREIVLAQAHMCFTIPGKNGGTANLIAVADHTNPNRQQTAVRIVLGTVLMPGLVHSVKEENFDDRETFANARKLVPILDIPPLVGRKNDWAAQAALSSWIVVTMRLQAREIALTGSTPLDDDTLRILANRVGLTPDLLPGVLDRWTNDGEDGPAFLHRAGTNRYMLGATHRAAWQYLTAAGRAERNARRAGKIRSQHRRNRGKK